MGNWKEEKSALLDEKLKDTKIRDIRFYRIEEFKRNISRVEEFSKSCPYCQKQKIDISSAVDKIDEAVNIPGKERRNYDRLISRLAQHMQKEHGFYAPYYYTYLYSFFGIIAGLVLGYLLLKMLPQYNWAMMSLGFVVGLFAGYLLGTGKDNKIRSDKMIM